MPDEANIALYYNLFCVEEFIETILKKKKETGIIFTGRLN